jgi:hypothetical protein
MKLIRILPIALVVLAGALVAAGTIHTSSLAPATTPAGAVQSLLDHVKAKDMRGAYSYVAKQSGTDFDSFARNLRGSSGSLRTYSSLQKFETKVLHKNDQQAMVRASLQWASAVGALYETHDLQVVPEDNSWKVLWPVSKQSKVPPQVIPVNYLRWDIITRGADDDWGAQNVDPPRVRIVSMNAIARDGGTIVMGEIVNEDTVPGFITVSATLLAKDDKILGQEESFDKVSHTLLPKEVSPFRIDFPDVKFSSVKSVRMQPTSLLVPAAADPVIGVLRQRLEKDVRGHPVLTGELINQSGQIVNIPHVLATYYDNAGRVIWVSDGYVSHALLPQTPLPFSVDVPGEVVDNVHSYRVTVNQYSLNASTARRQ